MNELAKKQAPFLDWLKKIKRFKTDSQLAYAFKTDRGLISKYRSGKVKVGANFIVSVLAGTGISYADLMAKLEG